MASGLDTSSESTESWGVFARQQWNSFRGKDEIDRLKRLVHELTSRNAELEYELRNCRINRQNLEEVAKPTSIQDGENHEATRKKLERLQALLAAEHSRDDEACFKKAVLSLRQYSQRITRFSNLDALNTVPSLVAAVNRLIFEFGWLRWTYLADFLEVGRDRIIADRSAFLEEITCANILLQWVKLLPTNDGRKLNQLVKELKRNKIEEIRQSLSTNNQACREEAGQRRVSATRQNEERVSEVYRQIRDGAYDEKTTELDRLHFMRTEDMYRDLKTLLQRLREPPVVPPRTAQAYVAQNHHTPLSRSASERFPQGYGQYNPRSEGERRFNDPQVPAENTQPQRPFEDSQQGVQDVSLHRSANARYRDYDENASRFRVNFSPRDQAQHSRPNDAQRSRHSSGSHVTSDETIPMQLVGHQRHSGTHALAHVTQPGRRDSGTMYQQRRLPPGQRDTDVEYV